MSQVDEPNILDALIPKPLSEVTHDNPELHFIGTALLKPTTVSNVVPGGTGTVGVLPAPAREDHVHGMAGGGEAPPIDAGDIVTGIIPVERGGTGTSTIPNNAYVKGNGTNPVLTQAPPIPVADGGTGATFFTAGQVLVGNGSGPLTTAAFSSIARSGFALRRLANQSVSSGGTYPILWDTEDEDSGGWFSGGPAASVMVPAGISGILIVRSVLKIAGVFGFGSGNTAHHTIAVLNEYHMTPLQNSTVYNDGTNSWSSISAGPIPVSQGNTISVSVRHDTGAARNFTGSFRGWLILS